MNKFITKCIISVCFLILFAALLAWWLRIPAATVPVTIPEGASAKNVANILYDAGIISSPYLFLPAVRLTGKTHALRAGTYFLSPRSSLFSIIKMLAEGRTRCERITVPEGFSTQQIADALAAKNIVDRDTFLRLVAEKKCDGYLFPETYFFEAHTPADKVIDRMVKEFRRHYTPAMEAQARTLGMPELQVVILGSIIEKEAAVASERPLISGVFHNRLKKRWYLESCATVLYALGEHKKRLTYKDLRINSPYNTYRHFGLPPGPICNPGIASIQAALYPAVTDDMFFVVSSSGSHSFSRYLNEHIRNKHKRRK
jgi:UPF0755 protein